MKLVVLAAALLAVGAVFSAPASEKDAILITVTNGGPHGTWGEVEVCPDGFVASGFSLKVHHNELIGDNTAINGIRLYCNDAAQSNETVIESASEQWGEWGSRFYCLEGSSLTAFALRVVADQAGDGDDTAVNNVEFRCSSGETLRGDGLIRGTWGDWSGECTSGICGLNTKVQSDQGVLFDDTALNDVEFFCC